VIQHDLIFTDYISHINLPILAWWRWWWWWWWWQKWRWHK